MFSFVHNISKSNMNDKDQQAKKQECKTNIREEVDNMYLQNSPANAYDLQFHRAPSVDIPHEGYGKVGRSGESCRVNPYQNKKTDNQTLTDLFTSNL